MTRTQLQDTVVRLLRRIAPEVDPAQLHAGTHLREELDLDSFDFLQLIIGLSKELGVDVPEADYGRLVTLGGCVDYLEDVTARHHPIADVPGPMTS